MELNLKIVGKYLNGLVLLEPTLYSDNRGSFMETFKSDVFTEFGLPVHFIQENLSSSHKNVIRGLHFQWNKPQGKLISVLSGSAKFVELDIRKRSNTFSRYWSGTLSSESNLILWVPPGFANGFLALEDNTRVVYKCTEIWNPKGESAIRYNDPKLKIEWGVDQPIISEKDMNAGTFDEWVAKPESDIF